MVFQGRINGVSGQIKLRFNGILSWFQGCLRKFQGKSKEVFIVFQGSINGVSRKIEGFFNGLLSQFQGCFREFLLGVSGNF